MKYSSRLIIYLAVVNYLNDDQREALLKDLGNSSSKSTTRFIKTIEKHFDLELIKSKPFFWQDIWIYNQIKYGTKNSWRAKNGLMAKYVNEVIIPQKNILEKAKGIINNLNT
jgi:hypothetical protein